MARLQIGVGSGRLMARAGEAHPARILSKRHPKHLIKEKSASWNARILLWQRLQVL
jgi:hypothetical protein